MRDLVVITAALIVALFYARYKEDEDETALAPAPVAAKPPQPSAAGKLAAVELAGQAPPPTAAVAPEPAPAAQPAQAAPAEAAKKTGTLTISAAPWADVKLDGREVGPTPRRAMPVRPGKHTLQLSCPPLAHEARIPIELKPGQELHITANMHEDPPKVDMQ